jgi:hypothetical protein
VAAADRAATPSRSPAAPDQRRAGRPGGS